MVLEHTYSYYYYYYYVTNAGDTIVVGGNVPAKGGRPDIQLKSFEICPGQTFDEEAEEEEAAIKKSAPKKRL